MIRLNCSVPSTPKTAFRAAVEVEKFARVRDFNTMTGYGITLLLQPIMLYGSWHELSAEQVARANELIARLDAQGFRYVTQHRFDDSFRSRKSGSMRLRDRSTLSMEERHSSPIARMPSISRSTTYFCNCHQVSVCILFGHGSAVHDKTYFPTVSARLMAAFASRYGEFCVLGSSGAIPDLRVGDNV